MTVLFIQGIACPLNVFKPGTARPQMAFKPTVTNGV
jgi:hypothetical protein